MTSIVEVQQKLPSTGRFLFNQEDDFGLSLIAKDYMTLNSDHVIPIFYPAILFKIHSCFSNLVFSGFSIHTLTFSNESDYSFDPTVL